MKAVDAMTRITDVIDHDATIGDAAKRLDETGRETLPVVDHHLIVGVLSRKQIDAHGGASAQSLLVRNVMTQDATVCDAASALEEVRRNMKQRNAIEAFVVDRDGLFIGVIDQ